MIEQTGFGEYMLIVHDIARFARERHIPMGVRGSAAASIVLYCLDVTDIEPTQYRLVFERFLNPERISPPDVDFDFADDRRDEVIRYTAERYGRDRVAQIITFGTLGAKAAIRDTGRALGMSYGDADRIARLVPDTLHVTIDSALSDVDELRNEYEAGGQVRELIDTARSLEGVARHASTHAAGIVITREPLTDVVPLQRSNSDGENDETLPTTQYNMNDIEKIELLKLDYLGLTNLTILGRAVELIREQRGDQLDLATLPDGDADVAELLAGGHTFGVFQMESAGMRRYVVELQPQNIREVSAMVALFRPGPMEHIPHYIDVKHGRAEAAYPHDDLAEILDETYGVIAYQDQVLEIAKQFAGYTLGQADVMRKAMGKKIPAVMLAERERFVAGAIEQGYDQALAERLFDTIEPFAGYAFNKAHAFSYGVIAYQTAYLKAHYPVEYMTAVLMAARGSQDRAAAAIAECTRLGIDVLPPDLNHSRANYCVEPTASGERAIRYGLAAIKNVGEGAIEQLIVERDEHGSYAGLEDFARRINPRDLNRRALESLGESRRARPARRPRNDRRRYRPHSLDGAAGTAAVRDRADLDVRHVRRRGRHAIARARAGAEAGDEARAARLGEGAARYVPLRSPVQAAGREACGLRHRAGRRAGRGPRRRGRGRGRHDHRRPAAHDAAGQILRRSAHRGPERQRRTDAVARAVRAPGRPAVRRQHRAREGERAPARRPPHGRGRRPRGLRR